MVGPIAAHEANDLKYGQEQLLNVDHGRSFGT